MKPELKTILTYTFGLAIVMILIGFTTKRQTSREVSRVVIAIEDENGNFFLDEQEIISLMENMHSGNLLNSRLSALDLKEYESGVEQNAFVRNAEVFYDIRGQLRVTIQQAKPIARILEINGEGSYIDSEGNLLPLNARHAARVPIVEVMSEEDWATNIRETESGRQLHDLLLFIGEDKFWRAQIAHVMLEKNGEVSMIPQVTKQVIEFGVPEDLERKFKKILLFYKEILPAKGWNTYSYVNVKYENQIVCK